MPSTLRRALLGSILLHAALLATISPEIQPAQLEQAMLAKVAAQLTITFAPAPAHSPKAANDPLPPVEAPEIVASAEDGPEPEAKEVPAPEPEVPIAPIEPSLLETPMIPESPPDAVQRAPQVAGGLNTLPAQPGMRMKTVPVPQPVKAPEEPFEIPRSDEATVNGTSGLLLRLEVTDQGQVVQVLIARSGGDAILDEAIAAEIKRKPVRVTPPPAAGETIWVELVMDYGNRSLVP